MTTPKEIVDAWQEDRAVRTQEDQIYLVDSVIEKLKVHGRSIGELSNTVEEMSAVQKRLSDVVDHTLSFVRGVSSHDKLNLFASIAVSGAFFHPEDPLEKIQEFLRITDQLLAADIVALRVISSVQANLKTLFVEDQKVGQMRGDWSRVLDELDKVGMNRANSRSAFVRLQSFGLIERIEPGMTVNPPLETPYELLELGKLYLDYLSDHGSVG